MRADVQTAGRGRRGRPWQHRPGNLAASLCLRPGDGEPAHQLSLVAGVALDDALSAWVPANRLMLKWPNDVLLDGVKLAGILVERAGPAVILGFGVNLDHHPDGLDPPSTSVAAAGLPPPSPAQLLEALRDAMTRWRDRWRSEGLAPVRARFLARAHPMGTRLVARLADGSAIPGWFEGLAEDGALNLRLDNGAIRAIHAADVFAI